MAYLSCAYIGDADCPAHVRAGSVEVVGHAALSRLLITSTSSVPSIDVSGSTVC